MAMSDSVFSFEMFVEELNSYVPCKEYYITSKFTDVFTLILKDPNYVDTSKLPLYKSKRIKLRKNAKLLAKKSSTEGKLQQPGQSVMFTSRIDKLMVNMKNFPIYLTLCDKKDHNTKLGYTHIPWNSIFIDYLYKIIAKSEGDPPYISSRYNVYDEVTAKRIATLRINSKLTVLRDTVLTDRSLSRENYNRNITTGIDSTILTTLKQTASIFLPVEAGAFDTNFGLKRFVEACRKHKMNEEEVTLPIAFKNENNLEPPIVIKEVELEDNCLHNNDLVSFIKSDTELKRKKEIEDVEVIKPNSCTSINGKQLNILNYIFGESNGPHNQVLCVNYFTVENDFNTDTSTSKGTSKPESSEKSSTRERYTFKLCDENCQGRSYKCGHADSECSLDLPKEEAENIDVKKCNIIECDNRTHRKAPSPPSELIRLDLSNYNQECCVTKTEEEEVVQSATGDIGDCYCTCECNFGFYKRTTYCGICGGYEDIGDDLTNLLNAHACPLFYNMKKKDSTPSEKSVKNKCDDILARAKKASQTRSKTIASGKSVATTTESEKGINKKKKQGKRGKKESTEKKEQNPYGEIFKYNYGYTGIPPHIGHGECCHYDEKVPREMGWLWTAEDVPGLKFRPSWKPGAAHKHVVRLLKMAEHPGVILSKKKRKDMGKKKKSLKRPLLTVAKKDGEYTVTLETMKMYPKQRAINQHPYEDKPLVTYTIGRTEEENRERKKKKEREARRLERDQRAFIQSAFSDMCKEICLKTYQQALGILPEAEIPDCPCYPIDPGPEDTNLDRSCSCSDDPDIGVCSDTDSDEWIVEVTPPNAKFDPTFKGKKILKYDNTTQYTYLDYRVKLLDKSGAQVARFFKGPDGKTQCSDLGGFWGPNKKWLQINVDGFIAPDERWAPMIFTGPNGDLVECEGGKFQTGSGKWLVVGVDGYVDYTGTWKYYDEHKNEANKKRFRKKVAEDKKGRESPYKPSEATWSCFGDADPKDLSEMGILGHGTDKRLLLKTLQEMLNHGEDVRIPQPSTVPRLAPKKGKSKNQKTFKAYDSHSFFFDRQNCKHSVPSDKGIMAVDGYGNKTYFKLKDHKNVRPDERITTLTDQGISLSSFHVPCFSSFINAEMMKQQLIERRMNMGPKSGSYSEQHSGTTEQHVYKNIVV